MPEISNACLAFAEDLSALIDEELDAVREAEVRAHLVTCAPCAERLQDLCNADLALAGLSTQAPADDLRARFDARLAASVSQSRAAQPVRRAPLRPRRRRLALGIAGGLAAAAAVLLALLVGLPRDAAEPRVQVARETPPEPVTSPQMPSPEVVAPEPEVIAEAPAPAAVEPVAPQAPSPAPATDPAVASPQLAALDALPDEDAALLLDLDTVAELDLMANLDLLEAMVDLGMADGA